MNTFPRIRPRAVNPRLLDLFSSMCLVLAVIFWFWPASSGVGVAPSTDRSVPAGVDAPSGASAPAMAAASLDSNLARVIGGNVFSASRRAPAMAFVAPGQRAAAEVSAMAGVMDGVATVGQPDSLPRLTGIISLAGERRALLQLVASDAAPRLYRVGESHAGYRIASIGADRVVLTSRAGTRTVRLAPPTTPAVPPTVPDSLENLP